VSGYFVLAFAILFFSPTLMVLLQLALSRSREFNADLGAVQLTGDANGLASALRKLERLNYHGSFWQRILQPGSHRAQPAFLRTHPPTEERVRRLLEHIEDSAGGPGITYVDRPRRLAVNQPRVRARPRYHVSNGLWY
jgi:heat shock protein HtpX